MYRASALLAIRARLRLDRGKRIAELISGHRIDVQDGSVIIDDEDVSHLIRTPRISEAASVVSSHTPVRREMVRLQRTFAGRRDTVAEGRDMATVVFPGADLKVYVTADIVQRALRRLGETRGASVEQMLPRTVEDLMRRDRRDRGRADSPLRRAPDAWMVDTTGMTVAGQVGRVVSLWRRERSGRA